ncbi:hypothetical protein GM418_21070 [Maribellus comscasis]|uniref:Uncharacterized protein n=1 Tax=Maribellus comscasis TaxID=2681766 RepID=A0A6I6K0J1_9BACT|nr:hypothetical protein [Maribellus comscasis]QGY46067.1 hypothetical protein GM418_21070 [Maribellus comscasis]
MDLNTSIFQKEQKNRQKRKEIRNGAARGENAGLARNFELSALDFKPIMPRHMFGLAFSESAGLQAGRLTLDFFFGF